MTGFSSTGGSISCDDSSGSRVNFLAWGDDICDITGSWPFKHLSSILSFFFVAIVPLSSGSCLVSVPSVLISSTWPLIDRSNPTSQFRFCAVRFLRALPPLSRVFSYSPFSSCGIVSSQSFSLADFTFLVSFLFLFPPFSFTFLAFLFLFWTLLESWFSSISNAFFLLGPVGFPSNGFWRYVKPREHSSSFSKAGRDDSSVNSLSSSVFSLWLTSSTSDPFSLTFNLRLGPTSSMQTVSWESVPKLHLLDFSEALVSVANPAISSPEYATTSLSVLFSQLWLLSSDFLRSLPGVLLYSKGGISSSREVLDNNHALPAFARLRTSLSLSSTIALIESIPDFIFKGFLFRETFGFSSSFFLAITSFAASSPLFVFFSFLLFSLPLFFSGWAFFTSRLSFVLSSGSGTLFLRLKDSSILLFITSRLFRTLSVSWRSL